MQKRLANMLPIPLGLLAALITWFNESSADPTDRLRLTAVAGLGVMMVTALVLLGLTRRRRG